MDKLLWIVDNFLISIVMGSLKLSTYSQALLLEEYIYLGNKIRVLVEY